MKWNACPLPLLCVLVLLGTSTSVFGQGDGLSGEASLSKAEQAAQNWLHQYDDGALERTWRGASPILREETTQEQWRTQSTRARTQLGALRSRRLIRAQRRDSLRQAPESGPFVLLRYRSEYAAGLYVETILLSREGEAWTVAGYEVAPMAMPTRQGPR